MKIRSPNSYKLTSNSMGAFATMPASYIEKDRKVTSELRSAIA